MAFKIFFSKFASVFNFFIGFNVNKIYAILFFAMMVCVGCEWQLKPNDRDAEDVQISIERYDRVENLYLTTGDYSALQQMKMTYPMQTRMLIEDMLRLGKVNAPDINVKLLYFFKDSTLQTMLKDVQEEYDDVSDLNAELSDAFSRLKEKLPSLEIPQVYTQIGSFDQSIVVGNGTLGISLDKYLGADYPFYLQHYTDEQRRGMVRSMIVPDCLAFYLLSIYPLPQRLAVSPTDRDRHMGRIQWTVNEVMGRPVFSNLFVDSVSRMMKPNSQLTIDQLLNVK